jgi:hypothetical protein
LEYAQQLLDGTLPPADEYGRPNPKPNKIFSRERLIQHMEKCSESYILRSDPRRFLSQFELFESVSGSDNIAVSIEVRSRLLVIMDIVKFLELFMLMIEIPSHRIPFMTTIMQITIGLMLHSRTLFLTLHLNRLLNSCTLIVLTFYVLILIMSLTVKMVPSHFFAC